MEKSKLYLTVLARLLSSVEALYRAMTDDQRKHGTIESAVQELYRSANAMSDLIHNEMPHSQESFSVLARLLISVESLYQAMIDDQPQHGTIESAIQELYGSANAISDVVWKHVRE